MRVRVILSVFAVILFLASYAYTNDYYTHGNFPSPTSPATSSSMRAELDLISSGFDRLPTLTGNAGRAIVVNGGGTGLTVTGGGLSLGGNLSLTGAFNTTLVQQSSSTFTLPPVSGTLATLAGTETFSNKTFTNPIISNPTFSGTAAGSLTNLALTTPIFSSITNGGTLTLPSSTDTLLGRNTIDTLTNKTLTSPILNGTITGSAIVAPANGGLGISTTPANGTLPIGNGTTYINASLTAGQGISVTAGAGSITVGNTGSPSGVIQMYAGAAAPTGWLLCDGSAISRTGANANLFAAIGTTFGAGDGSTTFNLPDMRGRIAVGVGTGTLTETITNQTASGNAVPVASNNTKWITGQQVTVSGASGFTGLTNGTWFIVRASSTTVQFSTSLANAQNGTVATITGTGSAVLTGTLTARTLGEVGGEQAHAMSNTELLAHTHSVGISTQNLMTSGANPTSSPGGSTGTTSTGGNAAANIMNPFVGLNYIIKL